MLVDTPAQTTSYVIVPTLEGLKGSQELATVNDTESVPANPVLGV